MAAASEFPEAPLDATGRLLETAEMRIFGLASIRRMMAAAPCAAGAWVREDDAFLLAFLRARKYKVDKSFAVLSKFTAFWHAPATRAALHGKSAEMLRPFYVGGPTKMLEGRDVEGNGLATIHAGKMDAALIDFNAQMHLAVLGLAWLLDTEDVQLTGMTYVETFEHFSLAKMASMRHALSGPQQKALQDLFLDSMPFRIRHIYVIHQPWYFSAFWSFAKLFFKKKITERVQLFGSDVAALHARVPASQLPLEFGGTLDESSGAAIDRFVAIEQAHGTCGGFTLPFDIDHPCGPRPSV